MSIALRSEDIDAYCDKQLVDGITEAAARDIEAQRSQAHKELAEEIFNAVLNAPSVQDRILAREREIQKAHGNRWGDPITRVW